MIVLLAFAFVAGAATALSPCVLPVLPVALSAGATGGRRRPLGVVTGLVGSFTFATVVLVYVISALGLPDDLLRNLAIAVLAGFGLALIVPRASARVETALSRLIKRGPKTTTGEGFGSGLVLGASLGLVYAPCAGPILAGVITVSASQDFTAGRLGVAFSYAIGTAVVLYALMLGGRRLTSRLSKRSGRLQSAMGAVMVAVAVLMAFELDIRFQSSIADKLPAALVNPTRALEDSGAARDRLAELHQGGTQAIAATPRRDGEKLPVLGDAPEIRGTQRWFNSKPLSLASLKGRVVLIDFWTYSCINCIRTLSHLRAWDARYREAGLTIIGVHAPEFPFERDAGNVGRAVRSNGLRYPVAQDNEFATWRAYDNRYWPAKYLIDARGRVRYYHFGEGDYAKTEAAIRDLLAEAGKRGRHSGRGQGGAPARRVDPGDLPRRAAGGALRQRAAVRGNAAVRAPASRPRADPTAPCRPGGALEGRGRARDRARPTRTPTPAVCGAQGVPGPRPPPWDRPCRRRPRRPASWSDRGGGAPPLPDRRAPRRGGASADARTGGRDGGLCLHLWLTP